METSFLVFIFFLPNPEEDLRVGAVLRVQNALPTAVILTSNLTAKDAIDNGGAGRAAKGANPLLCAKEKTYFRGVFFFFRFIRKNKKPYLVDTVFCWH